VEEQAVEGTKGRRRDRGQLEGTERFIGGKRAVEAT
jgi:hypothetical protein